MKRIQWLTEAALFDVGAAVIRRATPRARLAIGAALGTAFWAVDVRHRRAARHSIELAYGDELSSRRTRRLVLGSMRHFGRVAVEMLAFRDDDSGVGDIRAEGLDHLREALAKGRGLLGFSGHFGHWELLRLTAGRHGLPSAAVARPLDNPYLDRRVTQLRALGGNTVVAKRGGVSSALKCLRDRGFVTIMVDQRPERSGIAVPFFGHQAFATNTLAVLAIRTGAPIVPGFGFLETDGSWRVVVEPEVPVVLTGDLRADSQRIMTDCTAILERWIRSYPEQWLWTHAKLKA
jgi:Kdo2-lipid IVA lauroyltransferase/acyltransferase